MKRNEPSISQRLESRETLSQCRQLEKDVLLTKGRKEFDSAYAKLEAARRRHLRLMNMIEDPYVKELYRMHYIDGRTWLNIAFATGAYDESVPRKCVKRYMNSNGMRISLKLNASPVKAVTSVKH